MPGETRPSGVPRIPRVGTRLVGSLPGSSCTLAPDAPVRLALEAMNADPELTGIVVAGYGREPGVLSRTRLFETLGRPYGVAIFMNRPVSELMDEGGAAPLIVGSDAEIGDTLRAAMERDPSSRYEPIVIRTGQEGYRLVDLRALLQAQSRLLSESVAMVARQSELALALSGTLKLDAILSLVLEGIGELVPYERAIVYMSDGEGLSKAAEIARETTRAAPHEAPSAPAGDDDGWATFPLARGERSLGYLCIKRDRDAEPDGWRDIVAAFAASASLAVANARVYSRLEELAAVDQLTGVLNRRAFMDEASLVADRARLEGRHIAAIMLDLDRFKRVNDGFGHAAGDAVLEATASRLVSELRAGDIAGRFGGEEFVFLLTDVDEMAAGAAAERVRARITSSPIRFKGDDLMITASLGIATASPGSTESLASLIDRADAAMYAAKKAGRNRVRYAESQRRPDLQAAFPGDGRRAAPRRRRFEKMPAAPRSAESSDMYLEGVSSVLEALSAGSSFDELADKALSALKAARPGSGAALLVKTPSGSALRLIAQQGLSDELLGGTIGVGFSYAGRAALERRVVSASGSEIFMSAPELASVMERRGFTRYRAFPLTTSRDAFGVLEVYETETEDPEERGVMAMAAALSAAASLASTLDGAARATKDLSSAYDATLEAWVRMLELRDQETEGHSRRVTAMTIELAGALNVPSDLVDDFKRGALLHDIGKMGVPDSILLKPGKLTPEEREIMSRHPTYAYDVIKAVPFLAKAIDIPYCHHERWDGKGYPRGLSGLDIPLSARLFAVVDVWDALRSDRPYRKALGAEESAAIIAAGAGSQFDPDIVAAFLELKKKEILG